MAARNASDSPSPSVDQFAEVLLKEPEWFDLGVFLGVETHKLKEIDHIYKSHGNRRCLIELYDILEKKGLPLSWEIIAAALRRMENTFLANYIHSNHILPTIRNAEVMGPSPGDSHVKTSSNHVVFTIDDDRVNKVGAEYLSLTERLLNLISKIKRLLKATPTYDTIDDELQDLIEDLCGLPKLAQDQATFEAVFKRLKEHCSILNFRPLIVVVERLLGDNKTLPKELAKLSSSVEAFKKSAKMVELVGLIQDAQKAPGGSDQNKVKLKVRQFWEQFTMAQFETMINEILDTLYPHLSLITVGKGCICVSWAIPDHINARKFVPELPLEFLEIIGVISLHIGDTAIYNVGGEGCETIKAAMLQAIELENTRAIELLLAVGCSPEVATYHEENVVTNIVNISKKSVDGSGRGGVEHVCILGHNEHVEAIFDPSSIELQCSSCRLKEKMMKNLYQEIDGLRQQNDALVQQKKEEDILEFDSFPAKQGNTLLSVVVYIQVITVL